MRARASGAREHLDTRNSICKIKTKDHGQIIMHHGGRQTAIATATDVNLCLMFLRIFLGGLLRDKDA